MKPCSVSLEDLTHFWEIGQPADGSDLAMHATSCSTCKQRLDFLTKVAELTHNDTLVEPPIWVVSRAVRLGRQPRPAQKEPRRLLRAVLAPWLHPTGGLALAGQLRGSDATEHLLYVAANVEIDLQIKETEDGTRVTLLGQILATEPTTRGLPVRINITAPDGQPFSCQADEHGDFRLDGLPRGICTLHAIDDDREVLIEHLPL